MYNYSSPSLSSHSQNFMATLGRVVPSVESDH